MVTSMLATLILVANGATSQTPAQGGPGAKAVFIDAHSGTQLAPSIAGPRQATPGRPNQHRLVPTPSGSDERSDALGATRAGGGLHYYVEIVEPSGAGRRVNSDHVFRSGERIRLHFVSNASGRLALLQKHADGTASTLFPHPRLANGDDRIRAGVEATVPPEGAWLRFDARAGIEHLLVMFATDDLADPVRFPAAGSALAANAAEQLTADIRACQGSKDLALEIAPEGTYVVGTRPGGCQRRGGKDLALELAPSAVPLAAPKPGSIGMQFTVATEIALRHAP